MQEGILKKFKGGKLEIWAEKIFFAKMTDFQVIEAPVFLKLLNLATGDIREIEK